MNDLRDSKFAELLKDAIQRELQVSVNVFDSLGNLVSAPTRNASRDIYFDVQNWEEHPNSIVPAFDGTEIRYFVDCGQKLPESVITSIKMFVRVTMGFDWKELEHSSVLEKESGLVARILAEDASVYYDSIIAAGMELGYNLKHPMAIIVLSLEGNRVQALNMDLGFEIATKDAKYSVIKILKNHMYMNRQDIIALIQNSYLVILKAIEESDDRTKLYTAMHRLSEGVNDVLKSHRIFSYYIAPAEIVEDFTEAHAVFQKSKSYLAFAKKMHLDHPIIGVNDIMYYSIAEGLPDEYIVNSIRPKAQMLLTKNREVVEGLIQCFNAYVDNGFSIANAADRMYLHRNTIKKRLEKIYSLTGFDPMEDLEGALVNRLIFQEYALVSRESS